ncbi:L-threonylcarbamoyladenylate synthase [Gluconobacter wancherniae]|uniref:Threonylcarbamoyl-AMP synthase n=1 Tax=Gluconobacter wancherniae NBRC 103581 TaxID=656744 RepID=A0A511B1H3_9PROT|nr:L-threonylcarbamoyladenylate synthase [Gluconobacter wancherniae]MBF0853879.1 threonylcarbamoyl-AMP synthase [Gluconobacter wancherniae]MBS1062265.1 threonylcarbamoyl-AMP synthase [Gluconobacter wancherniae]MBS1094307.1 threonylcarbamoyl-AMP synthase [Gluconobacter wancherniae]MBS1094604.1 threonylcarbamoyl-AMP synthase [Gluconobacter wancherniae]GBD56934.1 threonylcarbamoyl-AMP synthase [Gluconobacter wancherniae NBRC 103581]
MTELLKADTAGISRAADLLRQGKLVAFGTETVYGLGALASSDTAVARIFAAKGRPRFNPLINHLPDAESAFAQADLSGRTGEMARALAEKFWPGPLTLVMPRGENATVSDLAAAGLPTLALRVPRGKTALALLREVGAPVAAPSANRSGTVSPSDAFHVLRSLEGRIDAILDSGPCSVGVESTVLDLTRETPVLLRPGGVTLEELTALCGTIHHPDDFAEILPSSPGRLASHYAPSLPVRLDATSIEGNEAQLAFGKPLPGAALTWNLSESSNLEEAAARLFAGLRFLDAEGARRGLTRIAAQTVPRQGLGLAIRDRLRRAAEPRPPSDPS